MAWLSGKKTYIIAVGMAVYQFLRFLYEGTPPDIMAILEAAGLATLRAGVKKV